MAGDVYVSFGADTAELEASVAVANAAVADFGKQMRDAARAMHETGAAADSELGRKLTALGAQMVGARAHFAGLKNEMREVLKPEGGEEEKEMLFLRMGESLKSMVSPVIELKGHFSELIEVVAGAFAVEKIADWASETTEAMEKVEQESHKLGVSMEGVEQLQAISKLSGVNYDDMAAQLERLQLQLARTGEKSSPAAAGLKALGISAAEFRSAGIDKQFDLMAEAASRFADGGAKTAAVEALLGRSGAEMIPVLDKGKEGLDELRRTAQDAGYALSSDAVDAMANTRDQIDALSLRWTAIWRQMFADANSSVQAIVAVLALLGDDLHSSAQQGGLFTDAMRLLGAAVKETAQFLAETILIFENLDVAGDIATRILVQAFQTFGKVVADIFTSLGAGIPAFFSQIVTAGREAVLAVGRQFADLGTVISDTLHLNFAGAKATFGQMADDAEASGARIADAFKGVFDFSSVNADLQKEMLARSALVAEGDYRLKQNADRGQKTYNAIWGLPGGASEGGADGESAAKPQVPQMNIGGSGAKEASEAVLKAYADQVQAAQLAAQAIETTLDGELQRHQITSTQWLQKSLEALDKEQDAIQDAADKALASAALTSNQKLDVAHREAAQLGEIAQKVQQDQNKAAEATQKQWDAAFKEINSAFDSQIDGLLRGTTSWGQAFRNVLATLTEDVVKFFVNWGLQASERFVEDQVQNAARVAGHVAGNATMAASDQASATSGGLAWIGQALKTLEADAASVFGGVFAFMAPALGPAAAGPAAAASGAVLAGAGAIASADIGMWQVPGDQLAMIHHNELIMPAPEAGAFRSMLSAMVGGGGSGAGGGDTHYHHYGNIVSNARDPRQVAKAVAAEFNRNPSFRPKY